MLGGVRLKVVLTQEKSCFAYISTKYCSNNEQSHCVQVLNKHQHIYLWVVYSNSVPEGQIAINPIHSRLLGLDAGTEVFVAPFGETKILDELYVDADSPDDQEILEHNAELLQLRILDQLRLVVANQKVVIWISVSLPIVFTPRQTGILVNNSKIIVKVDAFNSLNNAPKLNPKDVNLTKDIHFNNIGLILDGILQPFINIPRRLVFRGLPILSDGKAGLSHPYTIFIPEDYLINELKEKPILFGTVNSIPFIFQEKENEHESNATQLNDLTVEIIPVDSVIFRSLSQEIYNINIPTVLIPKSLNAIVNIENGTKLILTIRNDKMEQPDEIKIITYTEEIQRENDVINRFKEFVIANTNAGKHFLINNGIVNQNNEICDGYFKFELKPEKLKSTLLTSESFRNCTLSAKCLSDSDFNPPKPLPSSMEYDYKDYCRLMKSFQHLIDKTISHLYFEIHREANFKGLSDIKSNVLICGSSGSGKSSLCHIIQKELTVYSLVVQCRALKGRKDVAEALGRAILRCRERSPAVLFCDDIDALLPQTMEGASPQDIAYYQRLAATIKQLLQTCSGVAVLMTASSVRALHPTLIQFGGKPLFTAHFDIPELQQPEREELIKHLITEKIREQFEVDSDDVVKMAMETAGHNVRDVTDYFNKIIFKAIKKIKSQQAEGKPRLIENSSKDEEKGKAFDIWEPVGGMAEVKRQLTETIFWPMMYPALFPEQRSGILLYGPPGTGKSHIGSCLARLTNMNLIVVKGPELLSKYIGQSEKAVRDVFDKAEMKHPCILFFDEFDSLAPKRGHDSTGVTDRVVNQLLARLDGAEGGARGPVLAATSRPDLLDAALLRPGRLHAHLYCGLPTQNDRHEILKTLTKNLAVDDTVDLHKLSERTEGFTPADLKSLLVTAQLARIEKQLALSELKSEEGKCMESVIVQCVDIEEALAETKPSLSKEQLQFYDMIYRRFRGDPLTPEQRVLAVQQQKQRVTLA